MKITIIGTGVYSVSLAVNMKDSYNIMMWSENEKLVKNFNKKHKLSPITEENIPNNINITNDLKEALKGSELVVLATSAKYIRSICLDLKPYIDPLIPVCIASKGIENNTCSFLSDIVKSLLKAKHIAVISGPTFAIDLMHHEPACLSLATSSKKAKRIINDVLSSEHLKLRANNDVYGTQMCAAIKNVVAIASGILDGMGYKDSTRAFLLTESLHDIKELLEKLECNPKTILSFAGIGDLILTASSPKSRNYQYGVLLGRKASKKELKEYLDNTTTEGYYTLLSIKELTKNRRIHMPIINIIYDIAIKGEDPDILTEFLINKD